MRKPNSEIYNYVLNEHDLQAKRTLFIDDKRKYWLRFYYLQVWNLQVGKEDVVDLFNKKHIETPLKLKTPTIPSNLRRRNTT
jgi:putative hydrolase of the HAD superfamily